MIIIFKDYDFSHESIFQTIKVILRQVRNPLTSQSIWWVERTVHHQNALRQLYYQHPDKEGKVWIFEWKSNHLLFQKKEIFIEIGRRVSINGYDKLLYSIRLINITLLFITSWNSSKRFSIYFLFQNKIEIDIYIFLFNIIRYFNYKIGSTLLSCDNSPTYDTYYDEYRSAPLSKELFFFP